MSHKYMITMPLSGTDLQITGDDMPEEHFALKAASDAGIIREAEAIINQRFHNLEPFPGFHWQRMNDGGYSTTDHDLKA